jgi:type II secretion system protein H
LSQGGFTLIEMVIVVVIVGILASMAVGGWKTITSKLRSRSAISDLAAQLRRARSDAMARSRYSGFVIDLVGKRWMRFVDQESGGSRYEWDGGDQTLTSWQPLDNAVVIDSSWCGKTTSGRLSVVFDPEGDAQAGLFLRTKAGTQVQELSVLPIPGTVKLRRY